MFKRDRSKFREVWGRLVIFFGRFFDVLFNMVRRLFSIV